MRKCTFLAILLGAISLIGEAVGDEKVFTPPRLRILTESNMANAAVKGDKTVTVHSVTPAGLGEKLTLKKGDVITSFTIEGKTRVINSSMDLSRSLIDIRDVTLDPKNKGKAANIVLEIMRNGEADSTQKIEGSIVRTEFSDKVDGGTMYYFSPKPGDPKGVPKIDPKNAPKVEPKDGKVRPKSK